MTTEEKAKAYEEALERAREFQKSKDGLCVLTAESIFPELAESEDERIRKWLVDYFKEVGKSWIHRDISPEQVLAWLEKQKEHQNNSDAPNESAWSGIISSSDKDMNLDEIAQDYVDGVKEYNSEPTWDLMQTAVCYGYHYREQKEQKPAEWSDYKDKVNVPYCSSEPEWSEEDEKQIRQIERIVKDAGGSVKLQEQIHNWLKSLRPSWKPSEAQMSMLLAVINDPRNAGAESCQLAISDLYQDLKKL